MEHLARHLKEPRLFGIGHRQPAHVGLRCLGLHQLHELNFRSRSRHLRSRDWVFTRDDGEVLTRNAIKWAFWRLTRAAGLQEIRFHDLRHSFASQLVMAGVPLAGVKELLGHAHIKMTMRYSHLAPTETARYIRALEDTDWSRFSHVEPSGLRLVAENNG